MTDSQSIRRELSEDERLLWSGRPERGIKLRPSDALAIPFSLLWGGFAFFWEYSVLSKGGPIFFGFWGIPFVLVGLYMIAGRFFADAYVRDRTDYAVTDQRVLIVSGMFSREVKSLPLASMSNISLKEQASGTGTIQFGPMPPGASMMMIGPSWPGAGRMLPPMFDLLPKARQVHELILRAQREAR